MNELYIQFLLETPVSQFRLQRGAKAAAEEAQFCGGHRLPQRSGLVVADWTLFLLRFGFAPHVDARFMTRRTVAAFLAHAKVRSQQADTLPLAFAEASLTVGDQGHLTTLAQQDGQLVEVGWSETQRLAAWGRLFQRLPIPELHLKPFSDPLPPVGSLLVPSVGLIA